MYESCVVNEGIGEYLVGFGCCLFRPLWGSGRVSGGERVPVESREPTIVNDENFDPSHAPISLLFPTIINWPATIGVR